MTSPILLGNTQMCERALGHATYATNGGWSGAGMTGRIVFCNHSITVVNPNGATVHGVAELSCYTAVAGSVIQGSTAVDAGGQTLWGEFYFNLASDHTQFRFPWSHSGVAAGAHVISVGLWVAGGSIQYDANDGGTFSCWERP